MIESILSKKTRHIDSAPSPDLRTAVSSDELADFLASIIAISGEADDIAGLLVNKIIEQVPQLPGMDIHTFWIPFLDCLVPRLVENQIPLDTARYQQLFTTVIKCYIMRFVKRAPSTEKSLARKPVSCDCLDCTPLNRFLVDSAQEVARFAVNKQRRAHLHQKLDAARVDCVHETERVGSPQSLVVTKTFRHMKQALHNWGIRRTVACQNLELFDQTQLRLLLGDSYSSLITLEILESHSVPTSAPTEQVNASRSVASQSRSFLSELGTNTSSQPQTTGDKRKLPLSEVDIIDMISD